LGLRSEKVILYPSGMIAEEVKLEAVDLEDERFRISEDLDPARLEESLRRVGQLHPVQLLPGENSKFLVICGFRRLRALRKIGHLSAWARIWSDSECDPLAALHIAIWDNLSHRELNPLEIARALSSLKNLCSVPPETLVEKYLPLLGLKPHKNVLRGYLALHGAHPQIRLMLQDGRVTLSTAERLSAAPPDFQEKAAEVFEKARWSASAQREMLELVEDLASIWECGPVAVFDKEQVAAILNDERLSAFEKGHQIRELLYRWRNPRLSAAGERFLSERKRLDLPAWVRLSPDPFFESPRMRVEFDVASAQGFRDIAETLQRAARNPALEGLFGVTNDE
jgi:ParB-like chromosome segregation protein Spo0J